MRQGWQTIPRKESTERSTWTINYDVSKAMFIAVFTNSSAGNAMLLSGGNFPVQRGLLPAEAPVLFMN